MRLHRYVPVSRGLSNGARAGVTLAILAGLAALIGIPVTLHKRRKAARRAADEQESRAKLMMRSSAESSSDDGSDDAELGKGRCCRSC